MSNHTTLLLNLAHAERDPGNIADLFLVVEELVGRVIKLEAAVALMTTTYREPAHRDWTTADWATFDAHLAECA